MKTLPYYTMAALLLCLASGIAQDAAQILTPAPRPEPRVNGPNVFGVRPGSPFLYTIPATGERPMKFSAAGLPAGLQVNAEDGRITGKLNQAGEFPVVFKAQNKLGVSEKKFRIVCGEKICLTPPLGWNSWNCWAESVSQEKVLRSARALVQSGLANHGWTYINIDDTWQGTRGGPYHAIQGNEKFPDIKKLCDEIHGMGLKVGIYSTPWITSYANRCGGSSNDPEGVWTKEMGNHDHKRLGQHPFAVNDAKQWAEWGFDYLKYDWNPNDVAHVQEMSEALRNSGRDVVYSLSNSAPFKDAAAFARLANCWRTTGDIRDSWEKIKGGCSISEIGFNADRWAPHSGPGHWNDPDMLVVGWVGWGPKLHATKLTPNEQYSHISLWALLSAPLLIGCDLEKLDAFTLNLLSNDEVLEINQDALGQQAVRVDTVDSVEVFKKELEDGGWALGFFNRSDKEAAIHYDKFGAIGLPADVKLRDVWRQQDIPAPKTKGTLEATLPAHGVLLIKAARPGK